MFGRLFIVGLCDLAEPCVNTDLCANETKPVQLTMGAQILPFCHRRIMQKDRIIHITRLNTL